MIQGRIYILRTFVLVVMFYALIIFGLYKVESKFHLPIYSHISMDTKIHFLKHRIDLETVDTIITGSSLALNNINGEFLEDTSSHVEKVANLSGWHMQCPQQLPLLTRVIDYGNVKRIIYPTQYLDFTGESGINGSIIDQVFGYINEDPFDTFFIILRASKNLISIIDRYLSWEQFTDPKTYDYLVYDRTGSSQLNMGEHNADPRRWKEIETHSIAPFNEETLTCLKELVDLSQKHDIDLLFVVTPFRKALIASSPDLKKIMTAFNERTKEILHYSNTYHINAHDILNLDDSNFSDKSHLNIQGSNATTEKLVKIIDYISSSKRKPTP
jgi:hypothetical protein